MVLLCVPTRIIINNRHHILISHLCPRSTLSSPSTPLLHASHFVQLLFTPHTLSTTRSPATLIARPSIGYPIRKLYLGYFPIPASRRWG